MISLINKNAFSHTDRHMRKDNKQKKLNIKEYYNPIDPESSHLNNINTNDNNNIRQRTT